MKALAQHLISHAAVLAGWFSGSQCLAQTTYTQTNVNLLTTGANPVEKSATTSPNDFLTFSNAVWAAHATNHGGVFDLPTAVVTGTTLYRGLYATNSKRLHLTSSTNMQNATAGGGTFTPTSGGNLTTSSANQSSYSLAIGPVVDPTTGSPLATEALGSIGFVILSRTATAYPLDLRATVTFNDGSTQSATTNIGNPRATDDTFFGFTAPGDLVITN